MRNNRRDLGGSSTLVRLLLALALFMPASPAVGAEPAGSAVPTVATVGNVGAALDRVSVDVKQKIDDDIETTASAFWYVYDVERARRPADIFGAALASVNFGIATAARIVNPADIGQQLSLVAKAGNWLSLGAYLVSTTAALEDASGNLLWAFGGPPYVVAVKQMYDRACQQPGEDEFKGVIKQSLRELIDILPPTRTEGYGKGTEAMLVSIRSRVDALKSQMATHRSVDPDALGNALAVLQQLHVDLLHSRAGGVHATIAGKETEAEAGRLAIGSIAQLRQTHADLFGQYTFSLKQKQVTVIVDSAKSVMRAGLVSLNFSSGSGMSRVQTSLLAADSLGWSAGKYVYVTDLRQAVADIPQQMAISLQAEFANTWHVADAALIQVERMLSLRTSRVRSSPASAHDCDRLAVHPLDREAGLSGIAMENIDVPSARAACERAVREHPKVGRYAFNYARVALAAGETGLASRLMQQAASSNYILAQTYLGYAFLGQDAPFGQVEGLLHLRQNNEGAVRMFMKAALQGDLYGQAMLGWLYATGRGLRKSEAMARMWWGRAAANRDDRYENVRLYAEERLAELNAPGRGRR
jgi:hypothetical protein